MAISRDYDQEVFRWRPMLALSLLLHGMLFSALFWVPGNISGGLKMNETVYEVDLVDASQVKMPKGTTVTAQKARPSTDNRQARRIYTHSRKSDAVPIARRTVKRRSTRREKAEDSSSRLLDRAISKIKSKVKAENKNADYLDKAIAALDKKTGSSGGETSGNSGSTENMAINLYKMDVETLIKSYWAYPDAIGNQKKLEAVVLVKVKKDGTVLETSFIKTSGNNIFDGSVLKAIEKAKPLPPLPEGYEKNYEEIEIKFNLKDLE